MKQKDYDFCGWATKSNVLCDDGVTILPGAFDAQDGDCVSLCWMHNRGLRDVIGHAMLEKRDGGMYAYGFVNDETDEGKHAKSLLKHGDVSGLSIFANKLQKVGSKVVKGKIRELSLVISGANEGATIDEVVCHSYMDDEDAEDSYIIHGSIEGIADYEDEEDDYILEDDDDYEEDEDDDDEEFESEEDDESDAVEHSGTEGLTPSEIIGTLSDKQAWAVSMLIDEIVKEKTEDKEDMRHSCFESTDGATLDAQKYALSHDGLSYCADAIADGKQYGSFKEAVIAHSQTYGIEDINMLFPDPKNYTTKPEFLKRETSWVNKVLSGCHKVPFSRIKTLFADITEDTARAKGYIKGNRKVEEVFGLLGRTTGPCTIYKKQKLDKDDIADITSFEVVAWLKEEMKMMYDEERARAILIGDGRSFSNPDKIKEDCVRPIWKDDDLFTVKETVPLTTSSTDTAKAEALIHRIIKSRKKYKGSGSPALYIGEDILSDMLLIKDTLGHYMYPTTEALKNVLRVSDIIPVSIFDGVSRLDGEDTKYLGAILVNLDDYAIGQDPKGANGFFEDFDIDFNQYKYLYEGRQSGALTKPFSAIVYEFAYNLTLSIDPESSSTTVLGKQVSDLQYDVFVNDSSVQGTLKYVTGYTGYSGNPEEQEGNFVALKFNTTDDANVTTTVKMINGPQDGRVVTLDSDMQLVSRVVTNKQKIEVVTKNSETGEEIKRTISYSGLKLLAKE